MILSSRMIEDCGKRGNTMAERRQLFAEMREYFLEMLPCDRRSQLQCSVSKIYAGFLPQVTGISISQMVSCRETKTTGKRADLTE